MRFGETTVNGKGVYCLDPLGYIDFMALVAGSKIILTDSGGIQEGTTALGIPCLTSREKTERPVTITLGTNRLVGCSPMKIIEEVSRALSRTILPPPPPPLWDSKASERIVQVFCTVLGH